MLPLYPSFCKSSLAFVKDSISYSTPASFAQSTRQNTYRATLHKPSFCTRLERLSSSSQALCTARPSSVLELKESWYPPGTCRSSVKVGNTQGLTRCAVHAVSLSNLRLVTDPQTPAVTVAHHHPVVSTSCQVANRCGSRTANYICDIPTACMGNLKLTSSSSVLCLSFGAAQRG